MKTQNNHFYIYTHLGLGDMLICNAIIRNCCRKFEKITTFCKPKYYNTISFMYRDLSNLKILQMDDVEIQQYIKTLPIEEVVYVGHHHIQNYMNCEVTFDMAFYKQIGLDFSKRWTDFYVKRDLNRETELKNKLTNCDDYIFIHEDITRNYKINRKYIINKTLPIITPKNELTDNIFDYLTIIENAKEIHCMDSCFKIMIDSMLNDRENLYYHLRLDNGYMKDTTFSKCKLNWKII